MEFSMEVEQNTLKVSLGEENERVFYFSSPENAHNAKELLKILSWIAEQE